MIPRDLPGSTHCLSHHGICNKLRVESFTPAEQARFDAFCGALLKILTNPTGPADAPPMGLD